MSRRVSIDLESFQGSNARLDLAPVLESSAFPIGHYIAKRLSSVPATTSVEEPPSNVLTFDLGDRIHENDVKFGHLRNKIGASINNYYVQLFMTFLIVSNAILLGVLTLDVVRHNNMVLTALEWLDLVVLILFTVEFMSQLFYLGPVFLSHSWLVFDAVVVVASWIFMGTSVKVLREFRIFRVFSLASKWKAMQNLFTAVGSVLPRMGAVGGLLLLLFYAVTVLVTCLFSGLYDEGYLDYDYFGRLDLSFITLFQMLTTDSWLVIVRQVMDYSHYSYVLFFTWVSVTSIIILNLIVAIICDSIVHLKEDVGNDGKVESSESFKSQMHIANLLRQQEEIRAMQAEMELTINALMVNMPAGFYHGT